MEWNEWNGDRHWPRLCCANSAGHWLPGEILQNPVLPWWSSSFTDGSEAVIQIDENLGLGDLKRR